MSVTDGSLTTDGAQQTVRIAGTVATTGGGGGTVTQGTPAASSSAWPVKVTDGTTDAKVFAAETALQVHVTNTANIPVQVSGTVPISGTVGQGNPAAIGGEWPVKVSDGTTFAGVGGTLTVGRALQVATGTTTAVASISAATGAQTGTTVDFGNARATISMMVLAGAGVSGGVIDLQVSHDGNNWAKLGNSSAALTASTNQALTYPAGFRYARAVTSTNIAGGNATVTLMGS
jgi:hypothetical protein